MKHFEEKRSPVVMKLFPSNEEKAHNFIEERRLLELIQKKGPKYEYSSIAKRQVNGEEKKNDPGKISQKDLQKSTDMIEAKFDFVGYNES